MRLILLVLIVVTMSSCDGGDGTTLALSGECSGTSIPIQMTANDANRPDYPAENVVDGNSSTYMTTDPLNNGDAITQAFYFASAADISCIKFENPNGYAMGDLTVQVLYAGWTDVATFSASDNPFSTDSAELRISAMNANGVRLTMIYTGTGAYGATPQFQLSELTVYGGQ